MMASRRNEIDMKLLLYAIQRTMTFEAFLSKRFPQLTITVDAEPVTVAAAVRPMYIKIYNSEFPQNNKYINK